MVINFMALIWLMVLWIGYDRFAYYQARQRHINSLSSTMNELRKTWMVQLLKRDMRVGDATLVANLERNVTFLASSSMLILVGLLTSLVATERIQAVLTEVPFHSASSAFLLHLKIIVLIVIYIYAFFTFSWSMRQYGFATVVIGMAPQPEDVDKLPDQAKTFVRASAKVLDLAGHTYNSGLRAYYFSLSVLAWFVNPYLFMFSAALIVAVLYIREFHSRAMKEMRALHDVSDYYEN